MRVLIINTSERTGGAAIAANRLMDALRNNGIQAKMLVRDKQTNQVTVIGLKKSLWNIWQFVWERIIQVQTLPPYRNSSKRTSSICTGLIKVCFRSRISKKYSHQENLLYGPCMTCGHVPAFAIMPANATNITKNATIAPIYIKVETKKIFPIKFSKPRKSYTKQLPSPLSLVVNG